MAGYGQNPADYYQACYQPSSDQIPFTDHQEQYMGMEMTPIQQEQFEQNINAEIKEETNEQTGSDQSSPGGSASKSMLKHQKLGDIIISLEQVPMYQRRKRTVYSQHQLDVLEEFFQFNKYPDIRRREELAKVIYIPESRIQVWFQNRRGKARREKSKLDLAPNLDEHLPKSPPPENHMHSGPTQSQSVQQQPMMAQHQGQTSPNVQQDMFRRPREPVPYPSYSCAMTQENMMMNQASPNSYYPSPPETSQQQLYRNVNSMNVNEVNQSCRGDQKPPQVNYMMDFSTVPPNKTITPDMNITIPPIPTSAKSKGPSGINPFAGQFPYRRASMENDVYEQSANDSDSGISNSSPEYGPDALGRISSFLHNLSNPGARNMQ